MTDEWDGTDWAGTPHDGMALIAPAKAAVGPGVGFFNNAYPLFSKERTPQALMKRAQLAYHMNPWIGTAEDVVTRKVVGLPWHLEDGDDEEYGDDAPPDVKEAMKLIELPQFVLPPGTIRPGTKSRRLMWSVTSRHVGLCNVAYWFGDQMDIRGIPKAWLYINPARMWASTDDNDNLTGWVLDAEDETGRGGTPLSLEEVLPFYLKAPDWGHYGSGLYERAVLKGQLTNLADQHAAYVLGTGGRIAGIVSPKDGTIPDERFKVLVNEFRQVNEAPDAAKRTTILQGPIDFTPTAADPSELDLVEMAKMNRDDIFTIWGVPGSQAPVQQAAGLNSGETKGYDEAILHNAVHDRVEALRETMQLGWLDKYQPLIIELEIEEPEFDDETPAFDRAQKAVSLPLTNAERRDIIGLPPTGDAAFDDAILLPVNMVPYQTGVSQAPTKAVLTPAANGMHTSLTRLRDNLEKTSVPRVQSSVDRVLDEQREEIIARVRANAAHIVAHPNDDASWWNGEKWDRKMREALQPDLVMVAEAVSTHIDDVLKP